MSLASGCGALPIEQLEDQADIAVRLDANAKAHMPGRQIKFYVDLVNQTASDVDVRGIRIELRASPRASTETISLRHTWRYRFDLKRPPPPLGPGKRMTIPVVPEQGVEFPLEILRAGSYVIVAVVNDRFASAPYPLEIARPDLTSGRIPGRAPPASTTPEAHRRFRESAERSGALRDPDAIRSSGARAPGKEAEENS